MNFQDLHESVRLELVRRIELGNLTGAGLARQAGFQQAHVSNFLNRKRALSLEGLDRMLAAQELSVEDLMPLDLHGSAGGGEPATELEGVPLVSASTAMREALVRPGLVIETVQVPAAALRGFRWWTSEKVAKGQRFVAIRADEPQSAAMDPLIAPGAVVVLDRHYTSLAPYRAHQRTLYAVRAGVGLALRYVEFDGGNLVLRPLALGYPVQVIAVGAGESPADYIVGRVCMVIAEL